MPVQQQRQAPQVGCGQAAGQPGCRLAALRVSSYCCQAPLVAMQGLQLRQRNIKQGCHFICSQQ